MDRISDAGKSKNLCVTMPPDIIEAIDRHRGLLPRSTWLRELAVKELGLLKFTKEYSGLEKPIVK